MPVKEITTEEFITLQAAREGLKTATSMRPAKAKGTFISGGDYAQAKGVIDSIPDETVKRRVNSFFKLTTKYSALKCACLDSSSELKKRYPEIARKLANVATETDRKINKGGVNYKG